MDGVRRPVPPGSRQPAFEVFPKAVLSLPVPGNKLKRKAHLVKPKSTSFRVGNSKPKGKSRDFLATLRSKENASPFSSGVRKPSKKLLPGASQQAQSAALSSDLKRVLGHSPLVNNASPRQKVIKQAASCPLSSPPRAVERVPMGEIGSRLSAGLHTAEVFPSSSWRLKSTKAEICKTMKQSNAKSFPALQTCFTDSFNESRAQHHSLLDDFQFHQSQPSPHDQPHQSKPSPQPCQSHPSCQPHQSKPSPQSCSSDDQFFWDPQLPSTSEVDASPFLLNMETLSSTVSEPETFSFDFGLPMEEDASTSTTTPAGDLLDLADTFPSSSSMEWRGWVVSPVKRPRLYPQRLF